jgi:hypothetical protein
VKGERRHHTETEPSLADGKTLDLLFRFIAIDQNRSRLSRSFHSAILALLIAQLSYTHTHTLSHTHTRTFWSSIVEFSYSLVRISLRPSLISRDIGNLHGE